MLILISIFTGWNSADAVKITLFTSSVRLSLSLCSTVSPTSSPSLLTGIRRNIKRSATIGPHNLSAAPTASLLALLSGFFKSFLLCFLPVGSAGHIILRRKENRIVSSRHFGGAGEEQEREGNNKSAGYSLLHASQILIRITLARSSPPAITSRNLMFNSYLWKGRVQTQHWPAQAEHGRIAQSWKQADDLSFQTLQREAQPSRILWCKI